MINRLKTIYEYVIKYLFYFMVFLIFIAPLIRLFIMSLHGGAGYGLENYIQLFKESRTNYAIVNTILIGILATLISLVFGSLFAFLTAYTNIKRKRLIEMLVVLPFVIPSYIITIAWTGLLQKNGVINQFLINAGLGEINLYSIQGITFMLGVCNIPIVYLNVKSMLNRIPQDLEWACKASGYNSWQTFFRINFVQARPAIISAGILAFLATIDNFSIPAFLGISSSIPVLSTYIYEKAISFGPSAFNDAASLSVIISIIAFGAIICERIFNKKTSHLKSIKEDNSIRIKFSNRYRRIIEWIVLLGLIIFNIVPILSMVSISLQKSYGLGFNLRNITFNNYIEVISNRTVQKAILNSINLAIITCIVCIIIGTLIAYQKIRKNNKAMSVIEKCASFTYAIPGIVLALAMIFHWVEPIPRFRPSVYGTINILIIAYVTRYLIIQIKGSTTAMLTVEPSLEEAALASGSNKARMWISIIVPLLVKPVLSSTFLIFMLSMTELTLSSMLSAAGTKTIGLTVFSFQQSGDYILSTTMSAIIIALAFCGYFISYIIQKIYEKRGRKNELKNSKYYS